MSNIIVLSSAEQVSMADEWFDIATADHFWMEWRFRVIEQNLIRESIMGSDKQFFEIGCGHGQFMKQGESRLKMAIDGCDLNVFALDKINSISGHAYMYNIFDKHPDMLNKYDGIFLLDVIEHIDDDAAFLRTALDHAKESGIVIINVPALSLLFSKYDTAAGHKRRYSKESLQALLLQVGIEPIRIQYWGLSLLPVVWVRKIYLKFVSAHEVIEKGFKPGNTLINKIFKLLMKIELRVFANPILGTSLIAIGRKRSKL